MPRAFVSYSTCSARECELTRHVDTVRKEVAGVSNEDYQTAFDLGKSPDMRVFERKSGANSNDNTDHETAQEDQQEDANGLEKCHKGQVRCSTAFLIPLGSLEQDDSDGVVENGFAKYHSVQLGLNFVQIEYRKNGDWVCR